MKLWFNYFLWIVLIIIALLPALQNYMIYPLSEFIIASNAYYWLIRNCYNGIEISLPI
jgi:hypothetical protein